MNPPEIDIPLVNERLIKLFPQKQQEQLKPHLSLLTKTMFDRGITDHSHRCYILSTAWHESGMGLQMAEIWSPDKVPEQKNYGHMLGNQGESNGYKYRGRGYVQLTGMANYEVWSKRLKIDLIGNPHLAAIPEYAAIIIVDGMAEGKFTGKKLYDYLDEKHTPPGLDWYNARRIVNGITPRNEAYTQLIANFATLLYEQA